MRWLVSRSVFILSMLISLGAVGAARAEELNFDFRGKKFDEGLFRIQGPTPDQYIQFEDEGLRIRFPAGNGPKNAVGPNWKCRVRGDFTASVHYEILKADPSPQGTGVELYLWLDNETRDGLPLSRLVLPAGEMAFTAQVRAGPNDKRRSVGYKLLLATPASNRGRLRLERQGEVFIASFAEGDTEPFQEQPADIGTMRTFSWSAWRAFPPEVKPPSWTSGSWTASSRVN